MFDDNDDEELSQLFASSPKKVETVPKEVENILGEWKWKDPLGLDELRNEEQCEENKEDGCNQLFKLVERSSNNVGEGEDERKDFSEFF